MIIPVLCFECGKVLADKWVAYESRCRAAGEDVKTPATMSSSSAASQSDTNDDGVGKNKMSARGQILTDLGITRMCCRMVMLSHVNLGDD